MAKRGLGRGLSALIPNAGAEGKDEQKNRIVEIPLSKIQPNKNQPRKQFREDPLEELAESIKEFGVIQPIMVREKEGINGYEIVAGERRYLAAKKIGLGTIPALINQELDDLSSLEIALIENIQREDLSPIELSHTFKQLIDDFEITHEELSKRVGKSRTAITNFLRLLSLPLEVQKLVDEGSLSAGHARALLSIKDEEVLIEIAKIAIEKDLSVRELERLAAKVNRPKKEHIKPVIVPLKKAPEIAEKLSGYLNSPVGLKLSKHKGKIIIEFGTVKDLERIVYKIVGH